MLSKTSLFRSSFDTYCQNEESLGDLHIALKKVFDSLADSLNANAVDASEFIRKSRPFYFEESAHEDAEEYLRHLLNQLQAESTSEISPSYISETFEGCQSRASYCATCCEKIDRQEETFTSLILSLKQTEEGTLSIQDMVDSLYTESIENTSKCEKCEGDDDGAYSRNVTITFQKTPPCLLLNVKIFYYDATTGSTEKNMSEFVVNDTIILKLGDGTERRYQLFGIVWHYGVLATSGHYVWECKMDDQWIMFDDEDVQIANVTKIVPMANLSPYILVYTSDEEYLPQRSPSRTI
ncbi:unnamed protein product [Hymenolepis diminuta]|uniref:USP domain-containing protein n=1 Tax=Hymenolepis diminuta TaxID=6216 RepID=A0A564Z4L1_HYMDI|nr:unnamed protein product [Hymenolepis diminuta]